MYLLMSLKSVNSVNSVNSECVVAGVQSRRYYLLHRGGVPPLVYDNIRHPKKTTNPFERVRKGSKGFERGVRKVSKVSKGEKDEKDEKYKNELFISGSLDEMPGRRRSVDRFKKTGSDKVCEVRCLHI